jgi:hypothetical protein
MASSLPTEVLLAICEQVFVKSGKQSAKSTKGKHIGSELGVFRPYVLDLKSFSCTSRRFREVAAPLLFRNICIRTREQVVELVRSRLFVHVWYDLGRFYFLSSPTEPRLWIYSHVHFPAINILTCRRPLGPHIMKLVKQAQSLKVASLDAAFYMDLNKHLGCLLAPDTRLTRLEIYGEVNLPHNDGMSVLAAFVPYLPRTIRTFAATLPGGRPSITGIEVSDVYLVSRQSYRHKVLLRPDNVGKHGVSSVASTRAPLHINATPLTAFIISGRACVSTCSTFAKSKINSHRSSYRLSICDASAPRGPGWTWVGCEW